MASDGQQGATRVLLGIVGVYALLVSGLALPPVRDLIDEFFGPNEAQLVLVSDTPFLRVRMAVKYTQPDASERDRMRPDYAADADSLIGVSQVVATNFATIAAANDHWCGSR